jgi:hypothetical protein
MMQGMGKGTKSDRAKASWKRQGGAARQKEGSMAELEVAGRGNMEKQRVDFKRTRLSCCRMIRLPLTPSPSPVRKLSLFLSLAVRCRSSLLTGEGEWGWGRSQIMPNHTMTRKPGPVVLYNVFNTLCGKGTWVEKPTEGRRREGEGRNMKAWTPPFIP